MLNNHLVKLGFNTGEAKVYLALLNYGDLTATELSTKTALGRTNIYNYAKSLGDKGFISDYERNGKVLFKAQDPKELFALLDYQKKQISNLTLEHFNLLPKFNKLYRQQSKSPQVRLYLGKKDWKKLMKTIYLDQDYSELFVLVPDLDDYVPPSPLYQNALLSRETKTYILTNKCKDIEAFTKRDTKKLRKTLLVPKTILPISEQMIAYKYTLFSGNFLQNDLQVYSVEDRSTLKIVLYLMKGLINTNYLEE